MSDKICLFDMDGTLCDFDAEMNRQLAPLASPGETMDKHSDWYKARKRLVKHQPGFWEGLPQLNKGFHILYTAIDLGFEIHVLTQGPESTDSAWVEKKRWCDQNLPDSVKVTITQKKSLVYGRVLVDDWPPYFMSWLEVRPRGLVVAVAQPWNEGVDHPNLIRYDGTNLYDVVGRMRDAIMRETGEASA